MGRLVVLAGKADTRAAFTGRIPSAPHASLMPRGNRSARDSPARCDAVLRGQHDAFKTPAVVKHGAHRPAEAEVAADDVVLGQLREVELLPSFCG